MGGVLGALSFLGPIGESLGGSMELGQMRQQRQTSRRLSASCLKEGGLKWSRFASTTRPAELLARP
jgi:hypothetical protein